MWGGIDPWFYCNTCGIVTHSPGKQLNHTPKYLLKQAMDETWNALNKKELELKPFVITVGYLIGKKPVFTIDEMFECGYKYIREYDVVVKVQ